MFDLGHQTNIGTEYAIYLYRDDGTRIAKLTRVQAFRYSHVLNNIGDFSIILPFDFDRNLIKRNYRVGFWRKPHGRSTTLDFMGLIKLHERAGEPIVRTIGGKALNTLIKQRIIAYPAGGQYAAYSDKKDNADDMMKAVIRENMGSLALNTVRSLSSTYFSVASDVSAGPTIWRQFSNDNLLATLIKFSDGAREDGTEIYFDIVPVTETQFEFRTYTNQRGRDRTVDGRAPVILRGDALLGPEYVEDWTEEANTVYAGGAGEGDRRLLTSVNSSEAISDAFARAETFYDGREVQQSALIDAANSELIARRAVRKFTAGIGNIPGALYGVDWQFGDRVTAYYDDERFDCMIRSVECSVDASGYESVGARLEVVI